ncbi:MAG TPA: DNA topoisomerase I, partial [Thermoplasmatales archaeon]|nr:DNA topoisomerase I [Thermoplasmatales archaeon]
QIIDLAWGATLTRFISLASKQLGRDFLSVGRVQTPTLALIVSREKEIGAFTPTPYWLLQASMRHGEHEFTALHARGKFWKKEEAEAIYQKIRDASEGTVLSYKREEKEEFPPAPFNTTSFLREASRYGFTAASAMRTAESLYMRGYISYPRTDNTVYPPGMNMDGILDKLAGSFGPEVHRVRSKRRSHPTRGKTMSKDHPPIHPVGEADGKKLNKQEWRIYDLIVRRFLATLTENARAAVSTAEIDVQGETFEAEGYEMLEENWRAIYDYYPQAERWLQLEEGATVSVEDLKKVKKQTQPPKRYQQGSLLAEMEKHNLGTKSTRHDIIEKLYHRRYIKGKNIRPTLTGVAVTEALERSADRITKPDMTAELEREMNEIAEGNKALEDVVTESRKLLREALQALERRKEVIGTVIREAMAKQRFMGKCNKCGSDLNVITSRRGKRFVGCSNFPRCQNSYPLPQRGIVVFDNEYCDHCGAPIVTTITKRKWKKCVNPECPGNK